MWEQLLTVLGSSLKHNFEKKRVLRNMELSESRKSDNFGMSPKFPGIPVGNFRDRKYPVIPIPMASKCHSGIPGGGPDCGHGKMWWCACTWMRMYAAVKNLEQELSSC